MLYEVITDLTVIAAGYDGYKQDIGRVYGLDNIEVYNLLIGE